MRAWARGDCCRPHTFTLPRVLLLLGLCWLGGSSCEPDLRVPYIPPTLANWPLPYRGVAGLTVHVFTTGSLHVPEVLVLRGGSLTRIRDLPVLAFFIEHPTQGGVLFDTGLNPIAPESSALPGGLSALMRPDVSRGPGLKTQMQQAGLKPEAVRWIVLSSLQFEHTGAVKSFPNARVVVAKAEQEYARQRPSDYRSDDFDDVTSWKFIDFGAAKPLATFPTHVDLFDDGSCLLLEASGSTPGTMAMLVRLPHQPLLLADGMAAVEENVRYAAKPASAYDLQQWWDRIWRLKRFKDLVPELIVLPGHDPGPAQGAHVKEIIVHEFRAPDDTAHATPTPDTLHRLLPQPM